MNKLLTVIVFVGIMSAAQAGILYDTIGDGSESHTGYIIGDVPGLNVFDAALASQFQLPGEDAYNISTASFKLQTYSPSIDVIVQIMADQNGYPGNILATSAISVDTWQYTLHDALFDNLTLAGSTNYWVALVPPESMVDTSIAWQLNDDSIRSLTSSNTSNTNYEWNTPSDNDTPTIRIEGTVVPEPATLAMLGLAGLFCFRRRK